MSPSEQQTSDGTQVFRRADLKRKVSLKFKEFRGFLAEYSKNISAGGMFIRTEEPQPPGSRFDFELTLDEDYTLIHGLGEVVWVRSRDEGPERPAGMGVRFLDLDEKSRDLIDRIVAERLAEREAEIGVPGPPEEAQPEAGEPAAAGPGGESAGPSEPGRPRAPLGGPSRARPDPVFAGRVAVRGTGMTRPWVLTLLAVVAVVALGSVAAVLLPDALPDRPAESDEGAEPPAAPAVAPDPAPEAPRVESPSPPTGDSAPVAFVPEEEPFTRVLDIIWEELEDGLLVTLQLDGAVREGDVSHVRIDAPPPRELVKVRGVREPFPRSGLPVAATAVDRIRVGFHQQGVESELHVVLDLARPEVVLDRVEASGREIRLHVIARPR